MQISKFSALIKDLGPLDGLIFVVARLLSRITGGRAKIVRYYLVAQPVPPNSPLPQSTGRTTIGFTPPGDPITLQFPRSEEIIAARYHAGSRCITAIAAGRFAGFLWIARDGYDEDAVRCRYEFQVPQKSAWDFDVYVTPDFRIGRTFSRLWQTANHALSSVGVEWSYSRIESSNPKSLSAHHRLGIQRLFSVTFICVGTLQLTLAGAYPFLHLSPSKRTRPTFRLAPPSHNPKKKRPNDPTSMVQARD